MMLCIIKVVLAEGQDTLKLILRKRMCTATLVSDAASSSTEVGGLRFTSTYCLGL